MPSISFLYLTAKGKICFMGKCRLICFIISLFTIRCLNVFIFQTKFWSCKQGKSWAFGWQLVYSCLGFTSLNVSPFVHILKLIWEVLTIKLKWFDLLFFSYNKIIDLRLIKKWFTNWVSRGIKWKAAPLSIYSHPGLERKNLQILPSKYLKFKTKLNYNNGNV